MCGTGTRKKRAGTAAREKKRTSIEMTPGAFGLVVEGASWVSVLLRVAQFLVFEPVAAWRKATFATLAGLLALVAVTSGMRLS